MPVSPQVTFSKSKLCVAEGDHISHLNVFNAWEANDFSHDFCAEMGLNYKVVWCIVQRSPHRTCFEPLKSRRVPKRPFQIVIGSHLKRSTLCSRVRTPFWALS